MRHFFLFLVPALFLHQFALANPATLWWQPYTDSESNGSTVLGFWQFNNPEKPGADSSSHGNHGKQRGPAGSPEGKFGSGLESFAGWPVEDSSHGLLIPRSPGLSPSGAFTLEMWIRPKDDESFPPNMAPVLADSKYTPDNHTGFMWSLLKESKTGQRVMKLDLGLGAYSDTWYSWPVRLSPEEWHHIAFTYDAQGTVAFFHNGSESGSIEKPGNGPIAAAVRDLCLADRIGSFYRGFPGSIDEVRLSQGIREFRPLKLQTRSSRPAFRRYAENSAIKASLLNLSPQALENISVSVRYSGQRSSPEPETIAVFAPGESLPLDLPVDTALRPGEYQVEVTVTVPGWGDSSESTHEFSSRIPFVITPRPLPHRMPVIMWGLGGTGGVLKEIDRLKDLGFTHCLGLRTDYGAVWEDGSKALPASQEDIRAARDMLDRALEKNIGIIATVSPGRYLRSASAGKPFLRIDRNGNHYGREDISGLFPRVQQFCEDTGTVLSRSYGDHPAFAAALLHTEVRGESQVSFHPIEVKAAEEALGHPIPEIVKIKNGVEYGKLPDFPENKVIPDNDPILSYLRWFWTEGDGWNELNTRLHEGLKSETTHDEFWTFYDPAVRVPSIRGSGGAANVLSHWTYSYPDPIRIGLCTDELFEMARANGHNQEVMKMTQLIWYRSQTAPESGTSEGNPSPWVDRDPDAAYITIAPMHLREALWWKLSRPIKGIMYHGWGSLVKTDSPGAYRHTNPNTARELKRLVETVVEPLGPALLQVPDPPSDVAFLESFTSQMFARRGTYGWNRSWAGDLYHVLMYAQMQPQVLYEDRLLEDGLQDVKVLVMGDCDVLTESVIKKVKAFQKSGGLVVGDAELCPAIQPDILIPRYKRTRNAVADKAAIQELAKTLLRGLEGRYTRPLHSENPDVVTRRRRFGTTDYLFAVNDHREAGTYVGNYGMVMENGLPSETHLRLAGRSGHVYDLVEKRKVKAATDDGQLRIPVQLGPCEGRLFMVTERPVEAVQITAPESATPGSSVPIALTVSDAEGTAVDAVIPIDLRIIDPEGVELEGSGYYGAASGKLTVTIDIAPNDRIGLWEIRATERARGLETRTYLRVEEK
ncbi:MAG: LamG domain-containing protein [Verrucomicrobiales bacterium]|nr:LamG domain-containing protein [Verrucomicrobiales bacterium]